MKTTLMLLLLVNSLYSFSTISQTITCTDAKSTLVVSVDQVVDTMSFNYSREGNVVLSGDLMPEIPGDIPEVSIYNNVLADGNRYYDVMASLQRTVWVPEHTRSFVTRSGQIIEYVVPAHYEYRLIKWFNIMLKENNRSYVFSRIEGDDFGFTTKHPIEPKTACTIE